MSADAAVTKPGHTGRIGASDKQSYRKGAEGMHIRTATWLALSLWIITVLLAATALTIIVLGVAAGVSFFELGAAFNAVVISAAFSTVGVMVASRRPKNPIGWIMCAGGLGAALGGLTDAYAIYLLFSSPEKQMPVAALSAWLSLWITTASFNSFLLLLLLFPNGRLPSRRWRPVLWLVVFVMVAESLVSAFVDGRFIGFRNIENPYHVVALDPLGGAYLAYAQSPLSILAVLLPAIALVARFRVSRGVERQQLKWFVSSGILVALISVLISFVVFFLGEKSFESQILLSILFPLVILALCGIPISIGIALLRYRLYDIDILINRTLVYGSLTVVLAISYEGVIVVLQHLFRALTDQESQLAAVASTLVIAALFEPLRRRFQDFVDRRFYRRKYDTAKTLADFGARLRQETDIRTIDDDLMTVVRETMQPAHVSLWLRPETTSRGEREG
jgi:MFS family permease